MLVVAEGVSKSRWEQKRTGLKEGLAGITAPLKTALRGSFTPEGFPSKPEQVQMPPSEWPQCAEEQRGPCGWVVSRERGAGAGTRGKLSRTVLLRPCCCSLLQPLGPFSPVGEEPR